MEYVPAVKDTREEVTDKEEESVEKKIYKAALIVEFLRRRELQKAEEERKLNRILNSLKGKERRTPSTSHSSSHLSPENPLFRTDSEDYATQKKFSRTTNCNSSVSSSDDQLSDVPVARLSSPRLSSKTEMSDVTCKYCRSRRPKLTLGNMAGHVKLHCRPQFECRMCPEKMHWKREAARHAEHDHNCGSNGFREVNLLEEWNTMIYRCFPEYATQLKELVQRFITV